MRGTVIMTKNELYRAETLALVAERHLTQTAAAKRLSVSARQLRRLLRRYEQEGPAGLGSRQRGRPSNNQLDPAIRKTAMTLIRRLYVDFGPTLAREKLSEVHGVNVSVETLRKWMIDDGIWMPRLRRRGRIQQPRHRRPRLGELVQIDGCDHEWFEDRGPRCTALVFIDDATSRIMQLHFAEAESTFSFFRSMRGYLELHGKPVALYSDKASVFRVNAKAAKGGTGITQFARALDQLNIDIICANTPAAKGRVERAHLTLQDRLVKEFRLQGISDIAAANAFAPQYIADYNRRFSKAPLSDDDAHRALLPRDDLSDILRVCEQRKVSQQLTVRYERLMYILEPSEAARKAQGQQVEVLEDETGKVEIRHRGVVLPARPFDKKGGVTQGAIISNKLLGSTLAMIQREQVAREQAELQRPALRRRERKEVAARLKKLDASALDAKGQTSGKRRTRAPKTSRTALAGKPASRGPQGVSASSTAAPSNG